MSDEIKQYLKEWFELPTQEVLNRFNALPNAIKVGKGDEQSVFIPGTRADRVLLVAHSDTVFDRRGQIEVEIRGDELVSANNTIGIGADDRAGIAILWNLIDSGHSIFVPNGEEIGCRGSRFAMTQIPEMLQDHQFAIEFDRCNARDLVYYSVGTNKFSEYMENQLPGYRLAYGSYTDICVLCDEICGVNMSVGYYSQHSSRERLVVSEWINTMNTVKNFLEKGGIPKFPLKEGLVEVVSEITFTKRDFEKFEPKASSTTSRRPSSPLPISQNSHAGNGYSSGYPEQIEMLENYEDIEASDMVVESMLQEVYVCKSCFGLSMINENNGSGSCPHCGAKSDV